ncbi:MAG: hypothetical protein COW85_06900 [Ignavibacteria bacterium CG22_combo_CG10-13_8_21_14_all_37_15]|nr:hypothetical protein [Ignavibacteria bacterium]PIP77841.1 MAG: hypothetical protein COW85_06900 [Ignavibacteria bacterium CG22_combo_CG10-13_8_21_14_all_37_15]PIS43808.1 MAG: hypothetical protein COT22_13875 [Ignavibacteria bacterium CG08_land_8_20_14_0_20_37_9]PJC59670.1 MAG: hypothetical protein CO025_05485 [Ignavibacteria bacterium CG_4_9_14_0_2_um_filter_37_13]
MKIFLALILFFQLGFAQTKDGHEIIEKVKKKFSEVKDYQVDVKIIVDVNFLKVPQTEATIFFKQPDKVKIKSQGFALLPKEGLNFSPQSLFQKAYTSFYERDEMVEGINCAVVKVIPLGEVNEVILSTIWIDKQKSVIKKVESTTKMNGTFTIDFDYGKGEYDLLPAQMVFSFDVSKMNIPNNFGGNGHDDPDQPKRKKNKLTKGTVKVIYSNYKVNLGIADSIFDEKKEKK